MLTIGGVNQEVLAADDRAGPTDVVLPHHNSPDLDELPDDVRDWVSIHLVEDVAQVLNLALEPVDASPAAA